MPTNFQFGPDDHRDLIRRYHAVRKTWAKRKNHKGSHQWHMFRPEKGNNLRLLMDSKFDRIKEIS